MPYGKSHRKSAIAESVTGEMSKGKCRDIGENALGESAVS